MSSDPDFDLEARRWLRSWKAFDTDGPETIPRITPQQLGNLTASLEGVLAGVFRHGTEQQANESVTILKKRLENMKADRDALQAALEDIMDMGPELAESNAADRAKRALQASPLREAHGVRQQLPRP